MSEIKVSDDSWSVSLKIGNGILRRAAFVGWVSGFLRNPTSLKKAVGLRGETANPTYKNSLRGLILRSLQTHSQLEVNG